jgi:hypothetical protein
LSFASVGIGVSYNMSLCTLIECGAKKIKFVGNFYKWLI